MKHYAIPHNGAWVVAYKQPGVDLYVAVCDCLSAVSAQREAARINALYEPRPVHSPIVRAHRPPGVRDNLQPSLF